MAARIFVLFAPADRRWRRRSGSVSGSEGERAVSAARAARRAALKPYGKISPRRTRLRPQGRVALHLTNYLAGQASTRIRGYLGYLLSCAYKA